MSHLFAKKFLTFFLMAVTFLSCEKENTFSQLEEKAAIVKEETSSDKDGPVKIESWFPKDEIIKLTSSGNVVFGIQVGAIAGKNIEYSFLLNGTEMSKGKEGFFQLPVAKIPAGSGNLTVIAKNSIGEDKHTFSLYKNTAPIIKSQTPKAEEMISANCKDVISQFKLDAEDPDNDPLKFKWEISGSIDPNSLIVATDASSTSAYFKYSCTNVGSYLIHVVISDGFEETTAEWNFQINNPDAEEGSVEIDEVTPADDPVVVVASSKVTFAISVNPKAGKNIKYTFNLDSKEVLAGTTPFYQIIGTDLQAGNHTLIAKAANSKSEKSHTFNIRRNTAPTVDVTTPAQLGSQVFCGGSTLALSATSADSDGDPLSFSWLVNGTPAPSMFSLTNLPGSSAAIFTPSCSIEGLNSITLRVSDGYEYTDYTWSVEVKNPSVVQIIGYNPQSNPVIINSNGSQLFTVTANGKPPLTYAWELDTTLINGENSSSITLTGAGLSSGTHTLKAKVADNNSDDDYSFEIIRNAPPQLSSPNPTNTNWVKMNVDAINTFTILGSDANLTDTITYTWKLDGNNSGSLASSSIAGGSQAILSASTALIGNHILTVNASDGRESTEYSWNVNINYFTEKCNNLVAGHICTLVGSSQIGEGLSPSDSAQNQLIRIQPIAMIEDGSGNLFMADTNMGIIYFYNRSGVQVTRIGTIIPAGKLKIVAGTGMVVTGTSGSNAFDYTFNNARGLAYDASRDNLFVAEGTIHRVVRINSSGTVQVIFGTGAATNNTAANTDGLAGTTHVCSSPAGLVYKLSTDELFVACQGTHTVKKATNVSSSTLSSILGYTIVGKLTGGVSAAGSADGALGPTGEALANAPYGLALDARNNNLIFSEYSGCRVRYINLSATNSESFFNSAITASTSAVTSLFGTYGSCASSTVGLYSATLLRNPTDVGIYYNADQTSLLGFFVPTITDDRILYVNNTQNSVVFGGRTVAANSSAYVVGTGTATYTGEGTLGYLTPINDPYQTLVSSDRSQLIWTDYTNRRVRTLDLSINNGEVGILAGNGKYRNAPYNGDVNVPAPEAILNNPSFVTVHNNKLYIADTTNYRVRQVDLTTGELSHAVGLGVGNPSNDLANTVLTRQPFGMAVVNNTLVFVDNENAAGVNRTCQLRGWNFGSGPASVFGITIPENYVYTIAGNYTLGCANWSDASFQNTAADQVSLYYPDSVASNGTVLYVNNYQNHCILKIDAGGIISRMIGDCVSYGDVGNVAYGDASVRIRNPRSIAIDPRNAVSGSFFFVDQWAQATASIKYVNLSATSVSIGGVSVAPGFIRTVYSVGSYPYISGIAVFDNQICFSSGQPTVVSGTTSGTHNVLCKNRDALVDQTTQRIGNPSTLVPIQGRAALVDQEGFLTNESTLCGPHGIAFDDVGNLYIPERCGHVVRMVKKWW